MRKTIIYIFSVILLSFSIINVAMAEEEVPGEPTETAGVIERILEEKEVESYGGTQIYQKLTVVLEDGATVTIESGTESKLSTMLFEEGDKVLVTHITSIDGEDIYYINDYIRTGPIYVLFVIFVGLAILVAGKTGFRALLAMGLSFIVIFKLLLPMLLNGSDPIFVMILGSVILTPLSFYVSYGINKKTHLATISTVITLVITSLMAAVFVSATKLTGFASEEAGFLQGLNDVEYSMVGILLAGIIIGLMGVVDDVTVTQTALVHEIFETNKKLKFKELYLKSFDVGRTHIASMINTLILVYAGASMPLMMMFIDNPQPFAHIINYEIIATEIVRTLVGSIGLILAVPITTFIGCYGVMKGVGKQVPRR